LVVLASAAAFGFGPAAVFGFGPAAGSGLTLTPQSRARTAPADTFHATITGADGKRTGDRGTATVLLTRGATGAGGAVSVSITFRGDACHSTARCIRIRGRLAGRMTVQHSLADVGRSDRITATGALTPLGQLTATGTATGPGFIRSGHTQLSLTLATGDGSVTIQGIGPLVPGFTQP
jgi:hypothetical protein